MKKTSKFLNLIISLLGLILIFQACQSPLPNTSSEIKSKAAFVNAKNLTDLNKDPFSGDKKTFKIKSTVRTNCLAKPVSYVGGPSVFGGNVSGDGVITGYIRIPVWGDNLVSVRSSAVGLLDRFEYYGNNS